MSRKDRSTIIAVGMSSAVRDMPTKLRCGLLDDSVDGIEFPGLISWYERRRRDRSVSNHTVRSAAAHQPGGAA